MIGFYTIWRPLGPLLVPSLRSGHYRRWPSGL